MPIGVSVTMRGTRMWEFFDRLLSIAIPRVRDFRGLNPKAFDGHGNYSVGASEQLIFPEIDFDQVTDDPWSQHHDRHNRRQRRGGQGPSRCIRISVSAR